MKRYEGVECTVPFLGYALGYLVITLPQPLALVVYKLRTGNKKMVTREYF